mmetsp:Transcript_33089/g.102721  ORF Transcript_33089/g.102721 Transcript_33089/m.102721 type:complete len:524 (+) Transcript_33089:64-1635(+)
MTRMSNSWGRHQLRTLIVQAALLSVPVMAEDIHTESRPDLPQALASDDECFVAEGSSADACAANALQRRGLTVVAAEEREASEANETWGSCASYGCGGSFVHWQRCQCNQHCEHHRNCCRDYWWTCKRPQDHGSCASFGCGGNYVASRSCQCTDHCSHYGNCCSDFLATCKSGGPPTPRPSQPPPRPGPSPAASHGETLSGYYLDWAAEGHGFFDGFKFLTEDTNHGAAHYLTKQMAQAEGVADAHSGFAILRAGKRDPVYQYKRHSAKIATTRSWSRFLATMRFSHVPYGCGVWPSFFTLAVGKSWPEGGEVDVLEYVNDGPSQASFHSGEDCTLDHAAVNKYGNMPDRNRMNYACKTLYPKLLGCGPNKWTQSGRSWARTPGVLALERTDDFLKIFFLPEGRIPHDLLAGKPRPDAWDQSLIISYYPFAASGCSPSVMTAQQLVLNIGFCGDWASKVWGDSGSCRGRTSSCRSVDPLFEYAPEQDCCTQFIYDQDGNHHTDEYLQRQAFFNISWIKVFTQG